ncbi:holin [Coriobacteriales bacterium OH1046]|nr:holin [Coriobacteriales bacterium OH1046]
MKEYPIPDWLYQVMKWAGLIACPALAVFYGTVAPAWGLPYADQIVITLNALGTLIGILIGASQLASKEV